jgi:hypothetical protein
VKHVVTAALSVMVAGAYVLVPSPAGQDEVAMDTASYELPALPSPDPRPRATTVVTVSAARVAIPVPDPQDIPAEALLAYQRAAQILGEVSPTCDLPWTLLAAIGGAESDHGRHPGTSSTAGATPQSPVRADTPGGELPISADGPMQIAPALWEVVGVDADGDGSRSVRDLDDAALAAGVYLCAGWESLDQSDQMADALMGYRTSERFVEVVLAYEEAYSAADFDEVTELEPLDDTALSGAPVLSSAPVPGIGVAAETPQAEEAEQRRREKKQEQRALKESKKAVKEASGWRQPWATATRDRDDARSGHEGPGGAKKDAKKPGDTKVPGSDKPRSPGSPAAPSGPKTGPKQPGPTPGATPPGSTPPGTTPPGTPGTGTPGTGTPGTGTPGTGQPGPSVPGEPAPTTPGSSPSGPDGSSGTPPAPSCQPSTGASDGGTPSKSGDTSATPSGGTSAGTGSLEPGVSKPADAAREPETAETKSTAPEPVATVGVPPTTDPGPTCGGVTP